MLVAFNLLIVTQKPRKYMPKPQETSKKGADNTLKTLVFITCIVLLLSLVSAAVIFYASGNVPTVNGGIKQLGVIRINSVPEDVKVYLNDKEVGLVNKQISDLEPGNYELTISRDGYNSVHKTIKVKSQLVEDVFARLYPNNLKLEQMNSEEVSNLVFSNDGGYIYYYIKNAAKSTDSGIWRERVSNNTPLNLFTANKQLLLQPTSALKDKLDSYDVKLIPSSDNRKLLLQLSKDSNTATYLLNAETTNSISEIKPLEELLPFAFDKVEWLNTSGTLLIKSGKLLAEYNLNTTQLNVIYVSPSEKPVYAISGDHAYFYNEQKGLLYDYTQGVSKALLVNSENIKANITQIYTSSLDGKDILFSTDQNQIFYINIDTQAKKEIITGSSIISVSRDGRRAILQDQAGKQFSALEIDEILALRKFEFNIKSLALPTGAEASEIKFSPASDSIILRTKDNNVYLYDTEGGNQINIFSAKTGLSKVLGFDLNTDSSQAYILLMEDIDGAGSSNTATNSNKAKQVVNLYKISLVSKN
jgi:WD40 repeat protein